MMKTVVEYQWQTVFTWHREMQGWIPLRAATLYCCLFISNSAWMAICQTPVASPASDIELTFDSAPVTSPGNGVRIEERRMDLYAAMMVERAENELLRNELKFLRGRLSGADLVLEKQLFVDVEHKQNVDVYAHYSNDGRKHVTFTTGLYQYLDDLVAAQVMSREFKTPKCGEAYAAYLAYLITYKLIQGERLSLAIEVMLPAVFSQHHLDICPRVTIEQTLYSTPGEHWSDEYQHIMSASVDFAFLHEFAHFRNGDVSEPGQPHAARDRSQEEVVVEEARREKAADDYAIGFLKDNLKEPPFLAMPVLFLDAVRSNYSPVPLKSDYHESTCKRIERIMADSKAMMPSKEFQDGFGELPGCSVIQGPEQFQQYLNQIVR